MFDLTPWIKREGKEITPFRSELDKLMNRFFDWDFPISRELLKEGHWFPRLDISESDKKITVKTELPGVEVQDIDVSLDGRLLTVKGEKKHEKEEKEENYHRVERSYGYFNRTIELPTEVDTSKMDASFEKGVLKIELNKTKETKTKKIQIKTS